MWRVYLKTAAMPAFLQRPEFLGNPTFPVIGALPLDWTTLAHKFTPYNCCGSVSALPVHRSVPALNLKLLECRHPVLICSLTFLTSGGCQENGDYPMAVTRDVCSSWPPTSFPGPSLLLIAAEKIMADPFISWTSLQAEGLVQSATW